MRAATAATQPWIRTEAVLVSSGKTCIIRINLLNGSIANSFLILEDEASKRFCFIPICADISVAFSSELLVLSFARYKGMTVTFIVENKLEMELIISHLGKNSILFTECEDRFQKENTNFLNSVCDKKPPEIEFDANIGEKSILLPIVLSKTAKEIWVKNNLEQNKNFYTKLLPLRFSFLTWNVAGKHPIEETKKEFANVFKGPVSAADVVVIAMEEIEMSVKSVVTGSSNYRKGWADIIKLSPIANISPEYELSCVESVGTVFIAIMIKKSLAKVIEIKKLRTIKLGAGGLLANKAAILVPIKAGESMIMAVCCHLTAHEQNFEERNQQIREILDNVGESFDYLFFLGDLNYRIALPYEEVIDMCKKNKVSELLANDQLKNIQQKDKRIGDLKEPEILFLPTYKFDKNSDVYDTSSKKRIPSYTDRILYRTGQKRTYYSNEKSITFESDAVKHLFIDKSMFSTDCNLCVDVHADNYPSEPHNIYYRSLKSRYSDHRPVHALYQINIPVVDNALLEEFKSIIDAKYDEIASLSKPTITVEPSTVVCNSTSVYVVIQNKSLVWAQWSVKNALGRIGISPGAGVLMANESIKITIMLPDDFHAGSASFIIALRDGPETKITFTDEENIPSSPVELAIPSTSDIANDYRSLPVYEFHFNNLSSPSATPPGTTETGSILNSSLLIDSAAIGSPEIPMPSYTDDENDDGLIIVYDQSAKADDAINNENDEQHSKDISQENENNECAENENNCKVQYPVKEEDVP